MGVQAGNLVPDGHQRFSNCDQIGGGHVSQYEVGRPQNVRGLLALLKYLSHSAKRDLPQGRQLSDRLPSQVGAGLV